MRKYLEFFGNFEDFDEKKVFWTAFWIAVAVMILHILFFHKVERDSAYYYTRMAREFGEGRYKYAFSPYVPQLLSVLAGCFVKVGFTAYGAVKTVCGIAFIIGLFPFRSLMRRITNEKLAAWACLIYVSSSYLIRYTVYGYPFALKMFFLILSTYYVIKFAETLKLKHSVYLGISLGFLALARSEGFIFLPFYLMWFIFLPLYFSYKNNFKDVKYTICKQTWGTILIILFFILVCLPQMLYINKEIGAPFPAEMPARVFKETYQKVFYPKKNKEQNDRQLIVNEKSHIELEKIKPEKAYDILTFRRGMKEAVKGLYPILIVFSLLGLFKRIKDKKFSCFDLLFLSVILYNSLMFLCFVGVTRRYTAVTQPFEFGWVVFGGYYLYSWDKWKIMPELLKKYWKMITGIAATVVLIIMLINGFNRFLVCLVDGNQYYTVGEWIKNNKNLFPSKKYIKFTPKEKGGSYNTKRLPVVCSVIGEYGYWAEGDSYNIMPGSLYPYNHFVKILDEHNVSVLIYDDRIQEICPTFLTNYKYDFVKVKEFKKWGVIVFKRTETTK